MSATDQDHGAILFHAANPADAVFGSHKERPVQKASSHCTLND
jgi:hypothetical protein